jgi:dUTP pyrophosphatase
MQSASTPAQSRLHGFTQFPRVNTLIGPDPTVFTHARYMNEEYRGEVKVILINHGQEPFTIGRGDRIAQMVIAPLTRGVLVEANALDQTTRGEGGFGSTGIVDPGRQAKERAS